MEADRDWRERHLGMEGLLPIIRRVRRPLLPVEGPADAKPAVAPVPSEQKAVVAKDELAKPSDAKAASDQGER